MYKINTLCWEKKEKGKGGGGLREESEVTYDTEVAHFFNCYFLLP